MAIGSGAGVHMLSARKRSMRSPGASASSKTTATAGKVPNRLACSTWLAALRGQSAGQCSITCVPCAQRISWTCALTGWWPWRSSPCRCAMSAYPMTPRAQGTSRNEGRPGDGGD
eukprot:4031503-Prymnesium_polylepis.1